MEASTGVRKRFSDLEWEDLRVLPLVLFNLVAWADGEADNKELERQIRQVRLWDRCSDALARELLGSLAGSSEHELAALQARAADFPRAAEHQERCRNALIRALPPREYYSFVGAMYANCKEIAEASGGVLGYFSISSVEADALRAIAARFGLPLDAELVPRPPQDPVGV